MPGVWSFVRVTRQQGRGQCVRFDAFGAVCLPHAQLSSAYSLQLGVHNAVAQGGHVFDHAWPATTADTARPPEICEACHIVTISLSWLVLA